MSIERAILKRLSEYRTIHLKNGASIYRSSSGNYYYKEEGAPPKEISEVEYEKYKIQRSEPAEAPELNTKKVSSKQAAKDIQDFNMHYERIRKNLDTYGDYDERRKKTRRQETLLAFEDAIRAMIDNDTDYQGARQYIPGSSLKLIDKTIDHENSNNTSLNTRRR